MWEENGLRTSFSVSVNECLRVCVCTYKHIPYIHTYGYVKTAIGNQLARRSANGIITKRETAWTPNGASLIFRRGTPPPCLQYYAHHHYFHTQEQHNGRVLPQERLANWDALSPTEIRNSVVRKAPHKRKLERKLKPTSRIK